MFTEINQLYKFDNTICLCYTLIKVETIIKGDVSMKLTKKQVVQIFKEEYSDFLQKFKGDSVAKREAFNQFVDWLNKDGKVSDHQAHNWTNPF